MPLQSKAQVRALFAKGRGDIVKRWQSEAPVSIKRLPDRKKGAALEKARKKRRRRLTLTGPPRASGGMVEGAAGSTTRVGY